MKWRDITHISWRNIRARPGHTFMIVLTLALALAEVLMVIALAIGLQQLDVTQKAGSVGQIITIGTATNQSAHNDLLLVPETLTKVKNLKGVTGVTGVIKREAQLKGATQTIPTTILGIETEYTKVLDAKVTKGTLPQKGEIALSGKQ